MENIEKPRKTNKDLFIFIQAIEYKLAQLEVEYAKLDKDLKVSSQEERKKKDAKINPVLDKYRYYTKLRNAIIDEILSDPYLSKYDEFANDNKNVITPSTARILLKPEESEQEKVMKRNIDFITRNVAKSMRSKSIDDDYDDDD